MTSSFIRTRAGRDDLGVGASLPQPTGFDWARAWVASGVVRMSTVTMVVVLEVSLLPPDPPDLRRASSCATFPRTQRMNRFKGKAISARISGQPEWACAPLMGVRVSGILDHSDRLRA